MCQRVQASSSEKQEEAEENGSKARERGKERERERARQKTQHKGEDMQRWLSEKRKDRFELREAQVESFEFLRKLRKRPQVSLQEKVMQAAKPLASLLCRGQGHEPRDQTTKFHLCA